MTKILGAQNFLLLGLTEPISRKNFCYSQWSPPSKKRGAQNFFAKKQKT
jgi:hypothetical protein